MDNIDLGVTRLADKLQNAVVLNIQNAADSAEQQAEIRAGLLMPLQTSTASYESKRSSCSICGSIKGPVAIILGILLLVFVVGIA